MKYKQITILLIFSILSSNLTAQYISHILEYSPAPGQFINSSPWGQPNSANSIIGGITGSLNLGSYGGYVIFKFANSVQNDANNPYGIDFTIFGNPLPDWSEPAIVYVMKDENNNNLPDDTWYQLAGSDYFFSSTKHNYTITYTNPNQPTATDVQWQDNYGNSGFVYANPYYSQPYYPIHDSFPQIPQDFCHYTGTKIIGYIDKSNTTNVKSYKRAFGYADNQFRGNAPYTIPDNPYTQTVENSGGDAFDISWAVDTNGNYVYLDKIDFIKVQNAILNNAGQLGEISPEITGAVDVEPNSAITGQQKIIIIKDILETIDTNSFQLEVFVFNNGKIDKNSQILWQTNSPDATIDTNNILHCLKSNTYELTAYLSENQNINSSTNVNIDLSANPIYNIHLSKNIKITPNPASNFIYLQNANFSSIKIINIYGKTQIEINNYSENQLINITNLSEGVYFILSTKNDKTKTARFIKI